LPQRRRRIDKESALTRRRPNRFANAVAALPLRRAEAWFGRRSSSLVVVFVTGAASERNLQNANAARCELVPLRF
jgi:hypothetical protein